jgi:hypothetical protein
MPEQYRRSKDASSERAADNAARTETNYCSTGVT